MAGFVASTCHFSYWSKQQQKVHSPGQPRHPARLTLQISQCEKDWLQRLGEWLKWYSTYPWSIRPWVQSSVLQTNKKKEKKRKVWIWALKAGLVFFLTLLGFELRTLCLLAQQVLCPFSHSPSLRSQVFYSSGIFLYTSLYVSQLTKMCL
jgi:hypothetical protein